VNAGASSPSGAGSWLPDFCGWPALLALVTAAELVLLVVLLAPGPVSALIGQRLVVGTVFVQWLALCCALSLCRLRHVIARMAIVAGVVLAYGSVLAIVALGSVAVHWLDQTMELGLTIGAGRMLDFVLANTAITALVAAAAFRYFYVRAQWQREVRAQAKAQVDALQARIRPHFLFNSMNTIASLIRTRPDDAERAVEDLSELFRSALKPGEGFTTLAAELDLAQRYLAIERLRLGERLRVAWHDEALPRELAVPPLVIQPLVENAVLHGIQPLAEGGELSLSGRCGEHAVTIAIRNPRPLEPQRLPGGNRTALDNIRQRLRYHYGERGRLEVQEGAGYYAVTLTIPRS
jgi:two-component system sensor histidine kinase AlgZ